MSVLLFVNSHFDCIYYFSRFMSFILCTFA